MESECDGTETITEEEKREQPLSPVTQAGAAAKGF